MDLESLRRQAETPEPAGERDLPSVVDDLSAAFSDDVMFDWFLRQDGRRDEARTRMFRLMVVREAFPTGRIDRPRDGGAAAIWLPFSALGPLSPVSELRALPTLLFATGLARFGRLMAVRKDMDAHHPMDRPHAYLWFLGVRPEAQGRGVGSRLLAVGTRRLDAAGQPAYLETQTERNLGLYRRYGFEVISEHKARPDAPTLWSMWREPQAA